MKWTREGGLRSRLIARLTRGRFGMGRWTQAEVDAIRARARALHQSIDWIDGDRRES